jgi:hypothetical protein
MQQEGFHPRILLTPIAHRVSFPTCLSHPSNIHLHYSMVHRLLHFPSKDSTTFQIKNCQSSVVVVGLPLAEITYPTISLTWREIIIGLKTCFFYPYCKTNGKGRWKQKNLGKVGYGLEKYRCVQVTEVHDGTGFKNGEKWLTACLLSV